MDEDLIRQIAQQEAQRIIQETINQNAFGVSLIPVHDHDGVGSPQVDPNDLINANYYFAISQTTLSSSQIKALNTTPVTLVPAFGSMSTSTNLNSVIIVEGITAKNYFRGTAYTGANNLEFRYTGASGTKVTADIPNTFINSASSTYNHVAGITSVFTPVINSPVVVVVPVANPATGNGQIIITVKYRIVTI